MSLQYILVINNEFKLDVVAINDYESVDDFVGS